MTEQQSDLTGIRLSPPEVRLLLLSARPGWTDAQQSMAAALVGQVTQWPVFTDTARRKYVLPMVYANMSKLPAQALSEDALHQLRDLSMRMTAETLLLQASFDRFHRDCLLPSGVEHVYFKGPALAARFYPNPMHRFFRDIDILVPAGQGVPLLRQMRDAGGQIFSNTKMLRAMDLPNDTALSDFLAVTTVPCIVFPGGLLVELHTRIDQGVDLFDTDRLIRTAIEIPRTGQPIRVLRDDVHVAYLAYHHSKHFWNKLHWLADLDAVLQDQKLDIDAARACARKLRIDRTLDAALELHALAARGQLPGEDGDGSRGDDLLRACVEGLHGDYDLEAAMRTNWRMRSLGFDWQEMPVPVWRQLWLKAQRYRPGFDDLQRIPGGQRLQSVRYVIALGVRVLRGARRRIMAPALR